MPKDNKNEFEKRKRKKEIFSSIFAIITYFIFCNFSNDICLYKNFY